MNGITGFFLFLNVGIVLHYHLENMAADAKEIQIILRLCLVIAMYCQVSSNQFEPVFFNHSTSDIASWLGRKPRYMQ